MDSEQQRQQREMLTAVVIGIIDGVVIALAADPELPSRVLYRARLWLAGRDRTNYARLRWMRRQVAAGRWQDDLSAQTGEEEPRI